MLLTWDIWSEGRSNAIKDVHKREIEMRIKQRG